MVKKVSEIRCLGNGFTAVVLLFEGGVLRLIWGAKWKRFG